MVEQEFSNHPHASKTDQNVIFCRWSCEYSLIVLWPHTDECDRTAERGEGDKSHGTNTSEQFKTKAVRLGWGKEICLVAFYS